MINLSQESPGTTSCSPYPNPNPRTAPRRRTAEAVARSSPSVHEAPPPRRGGIAPSHNRSRSSLVQQINARLCFVPYLYHSKQNWKGVTFLWALIWKEQIQLCSMNHTKKRLVWFAFSHSHCCESPTDKTHSLHNCGPLFQKLLVCF